MRVYIFVEGETERRALPKLLSVLGVAARVRGPIVLRGSRFFTDIGPRAAAVLSQELDAHVFACPDLAPREHVPWHYADYRGLQQALRSQLRECMAKRAAKRALDSALRRFHPHPFKHDFEVVLLALPTLLREHLGTRVDVTKHFNHERPEDQDFQRYPKRVVQFLFNKFGGRRYNEVDDCLRILERAQAEDAKRLENVCPCIAELASALRRLQAPAART